MKKNFIWAILLLVMVACRKSDPDVNPPAPIDPNAFGMSISNIYNDPIKNLTLKGKTKCKGLAGDFV